MNEMRKEKILTQILAEMAGMNLGPGQAVPVKTVWIRAMNQGVHNWDELKDVLTWAVQVGLLILTPGGVAGLGNVALTDSGYEESRKA